MITTVQRPPRICLDCGSLVPGELQRCKCGSIELTPDTPYVKKLVKRLEHHQRCKRWNENHREATRVANRKWRRNNPEKVRQANAAHRQKVKEEMAKNPALAALIQQQRKRDYREKQNRKIQEEAAALAVPKVDFVGLVELAFRRTTGPWERDGFSVNRKNEPDWLEGYKAGYRAAMRDAKERSLVVAKAAKSANE